MSNELYSSAQGLRMICVLRVSEKLSHATLTSTVSVCILNCLSEIFIIALSLCM